MAHLLKEDAKLATNENKIFEAAAKGLLRSAGSNDEHLNSKYDIRSARGGKGGVVTAVANRWTTLIDEEQVSSGVGTGS